MKTTQNDDRYKNNITNKDLYQQQQYTSQHLSSTINYTYYSNIIKDYYLKHHYKYHRFLLLFCRYRDPKKESSFVNMKILEPDIILIATTILGD